jgi:hypothetical protein
MGNTLRESAPGEFGGLRLAAVSIAFGDTTKTIDSLAVGDVVVRCWAEVLTAFNAGTTNVLTLGDGTTGNKYLTSSDVTEGTPGVYPSGGKGPYAAEATAGTLTVTYAQTGTAATTGSARVYALISSAAV